MNPVLHSRRLAIAAVWLIAAPMATDAQELERSFESHQIRYKLPSKDWTWHDEKIPNVLFMAVNSDGFTVMVSTSPLPGPTQLDQKFIDGFEPTFFKNGQLTKRGGRFMTFQDRPCYQAEGTLADGRTLINRVLMGPRDCFNFAVIGGPDPVEKTPAFESILNGLTFTHPFVPVAADDPPNISYLMGRVVGFCLVGIVILVIGKSLFTRKTRSS